MREFLEQHPLDVQSDHELCIFLTTLVYSLMDEMVKFGTKVNRLEAVLIEQQYEIARLKALTSEWR